MQIFTAPSETVRQISGVDTEGKPVLAVVFKRTYRVEGNGRCVVHEEQLPLYDDAIIDEATNVVVHDPDLFVFKPLTDVVVLGHAYARPGESALFAAVHVGGVTKSIRVIGDRRCGLDSFGNTVFSDPEAFEKIALSYERAYGGRDTVAEAKYGTPGAPMQMYAPSLDFAAASPWLYPRNAQGRGYLVERSAEGLAALALPNLEDPNDLLTPERIAANYATLWPTMPLPACTSWVDAGSFPRCAWFGAVPDHEGFAGPFPEVARALLPPELLTAAKTRQSLHPRFTNGAAPELQLPHLRGDEEVHTSRLHPSNERWALRLPGERPNLWIDGRNGRLVPAEARLHTVLVEPDLERVSLVWCGSAPALRPYLPDELARMPLRVEV